jgi:hypothetical protein
MTTFTVTWKVASSTNDYYLVTGGEKPITVVHTKHDTFVCLTCRSHLCDHALAVEASDEVKPREVPEC